MSVRVRALEFSISAPRCFDGPLLSRDGVRVHDGANDRIPIGSSFILSEAGELGFETRPPILEMMDVDEEEGAANSPQWKEVN